jgi:hypothetical protein
MWYHQVSQTQLTISINYWYEQRFDFRWAYAVLILINGLLTKWFPLRYNHLGMSFIRWLHHSIQPNKRTKILKTAHNSYHNNIS